MSPPRAWNTPNNSLTRADDHINQVSLADIMSEQLITELEKAEEQDLERQFEMVSVEDPASPVKAEQEEPAAGSPEQTDDYMMALLLQREFDREYDRELQLRENKMNANEKVQISFDKYRVTNPYEQSDDESEDSDDEDYREAATSKKYDPPKPTFATNGLGRTEEGIIISKHDLPTSYRKNASKTQNFPPEFQSGDAMGMDVRLPNKVYNSLKAHSKHEQKRQARHRDKVDQATSEMALDANTRLRLFKLIEQGLLDNLGGQVATGKESTVLHAFGGQGSDELQLPPGTTIPRECAVKIFKTTLAEFKNRIEYVKDDYRFRNPRKLLKYWAEKEKLNLNRMRRAGIRCPSVVKLKDHILVMDFIGEDGVPAPQLRHAALDDEETLSDAYEQCVELITSLYRSCSLVHADLSEYNILYHRNQCYLIDVSQGVDLSHPRALIFLVADCEHLLAFFKKRGLVELPSRRELFNQITQLHFDSDASFLAELDDFVKVNRARSIRDDKKNPADTELKRQILDENYEDDL